MYTSLEQLLALRLLQTRLLGFDVGDKRIGVAISDSTWLIASPVKVLDRTKDWRGELDKIFTMYGGRQSQDVQGGIGAMVVGLPLLMNGDEGPQAQKTKAFAQKHLFPIGLPIVLWDERLSTLGVTQTLLDADLSRKRRKEVIDKVAAVFILQGVLDRLSQL